MAIDNIDKIALISSITDFDVDALAIYWIQSLLIA